ncbi:MAG: hypothetical protein HY651_12650 [Acidobacteria bacterium]|nr:hypothetical protein [Acidobacteriota bacterium]
MTVTIGDYAIQVGALSEDECRATIKSRDDTTLFEITNTGVFLDPATGKDMNGDGAPDAVIESTHLGAHCCSEYYIISLGEQPGVIRKIGKGSGDNTHVNFTDLDADGDTEIVLYDGRYAYWDGLSFADSPMPRLVLQLDESRFKDVSLAFTPTYDGEIDDWKRVLTESSLEDFRQQRGSSLNWGSTKGLVGSVVLAYLYSRRPEAAWNSLAEMWPPGDLPRIRQEIRSDYCKTVGDYLGTAETPVCQPDYNFEE